MKKRSLLDESINSFRIDRANQDRWYIKREMEGIDYLEESTLSGNRLEEIKGLILCFDERKNFKDLTENKKQIVRKLIENEELVDVVIVTLFQWFGTNCGSCEIGELMDKIRDYKYTRKEL